MASFDFTQLSSSDSFDGRFANPSINNQGTVTYEGFQGVCTTIGGDCLQTGTNTPPNSIFINTLGGSPTRIIDRSSFSGFSGYDSGVFFSASTNDAGTTVLAASGFNYGQLIAGGPSAVLSISGNGTITPVAYSSDKFAVTLINPNLPYPAIAATSNLAAAGNFASAPGINNLGTVVYIAGHDGITSLYTKSSDGTLTSIADTSASSPLKDFYLGGVNVGRGAGPFAAYTLPAINNKGTVAFNADYKAGGKGLFARSSSGEYSTIADTSSGLFTNFSVATINDSGTIAFGADLANGGSGIFTSSGGKLTSIADTSGLFKNLTLSDIALNQKGQVAFLGQLKDGTTSIFDGADPIANKVISVGDKLGNYTVTNLFISHEGLNDQGQIAFDATLVDGSGNTTEQIFLANPTAVPEASGGLPLLGIAILGMVSYRWRKKQTAKFAGKR